MEYSEFAKKVVLHDTRNRFAKFDGNLDCVPDVLKTFYKEKGYYRLQPENDTMDPIIIHGDLQILGKVFGIFRLYQ